MASAPGQSIAVDKNCPGELGVGWFSSVEWRVSLNAAVMEWLAED